MYCTPPCVIHLLQALHICMPTVYKSPHITLHHLSFLPSTRKSKVTMRPSVSAESMLYEVSALTTGHPQEASYFSTLSFWVRQVVLAIVGHFPGARHCWGCFLKVCTGVTVSPAHVPGFTTCLGLSWVYIWCRSHEWSKTQQGGLEPLVSPYCRLDNRKQSQQLDTRQSRDKRSFVWKTRRRNTNRLEEKQRK